MMRFELTIILMRGVSVGTHLQFRLRYLKLSFLRFVTIAGFGSLLPHVRTSSFNFFKAASFACCASFMVSGCDAVPIATRLVFVVHRALCSRLPCVASVLESLRRRASEEPQQPRDYLWDCLMVSFMLVYHVPLH